MSRLLSRHDSFNSSGNTIIPERESDIRSTSTSIPRAAAAVPHHHHHHHHHHHRAGAHPHGDGKAVPGGANNGNGSGSAGGAGGSNVSSLSSARVLMPQDTLGRELDSFMQSNSQESQEFAVMVRDYTRLDSVSQSQTDLRNFISRSNPDLAALINPTTSATDLLAQIQLENPSLLGQTPSSPIKAIYNDHAALPPSLPSSYPPRVEAFRPTSAHSNHSHASHHSRQSVRSAHSAHSGYPHSHAGSASNASASDYDYATTEIDEDEGAIGDFEMDVAMVMAGANDVDPKQLHIGAPPPGAKRGRKANAKAGGVENGTKGRGGTRLGPEGTALAYQEGSSERGKGMVGLEHDEEALRLKRLEHRRQINRKSAQKHRMRRREEHETLSKQMVEKDTRIAQLEKDLAVERSKTAQLQQFIDMQRIGSKRVARAGGRGDDVEMEDDESLPIKRRKQ